jgi:hypothetical protein
LRSSAEVEVEDVNFAKQFYFTFLGINHGQPWSEVIKIHDQPLSTMVDHSQPWSGAIKIHDQPSSTMVGSHQNP